jgi:hypothetical protein
MFDQVHLGAGFGERAKARHFPPHRGDILPDASTHRDRQRVTDNDSIAWSGVARKR